MKEFYQREWTMAEKILMTISLLVSGILLGFMFSPIKRGIYCGNHNGNTELAKTGESTQA